MKSLLTLTVAASICAPQLSVADVVKVTPIEKALQLLNGMLTKATADKHNEQLQFAAYKQFCDDVSVERQNSIKSSDEQIELLKADIQQYEADVDRLGDAITEHNADILKWDQDKKDALEVRGNERKEYLTTHEDYSESLSALTQAIRVLKQQAYDRPGASALLQHVKEGSRIPMIAKRVIEAFLATDPDDDALLSVPQANAYEFRSKDIVTMLEDLKQKFTDERRDLEKEEMERRHAFDMLTQDLTNSVQSAENELAEATKMVAKNKQLIADASGTLHDTTESRAEDDKYLTDLITTCKQKSSDFEARQTLRGEEIEALEKAVEILASDRVSGNADKHLPAMLQSRKGNSFAQLRAQGGAPDNQLRVAAFLLSEADKIGSRTLSTIALKVREDPFGKVKKLIEELITRLMEEANEEAEHKGWCDTELATNEHTRTTKSADAERLSAEIEGLEARIATLTKELAELSQAFADINKAVAEATDLRQREQAENEQTIIDAQDGQAAIAEVMSVLQNFYSKAGEATAFVDVKASHRKQEPPPVFDEAYQGQQTESQGVLAMLDVIKSDFARVEQDTQSAEAAAVAEYDGFMNDSEVDKTAKETDQTHKESEKQQDEMDLSDKKTDLESTQEQLNAAFAYFEKLKPSCIDTGTSYEDRVQRRKEEIEALQEALRILSGQDIAALYQK